MHYLVKIRLLFLPPFTTQYRLFSHVISDGLALDMIKSNKCCHGLSLTVVNSFSTPLLHPLSEGVTGLKELAFLRDLAEQNSVKYGVDRTSHRDRLSGASSSGSAGASMMPVVKGSMMVLNQLSNLETTVGRFYINLPNRMIDLARFSLPYADPMGDGEGFGYN